MNPWLILGALNGLAAVAAGAYGWHALAADEAARQIFMMGSQYQMWHALALCAVAWIASRDEGSLARFVRLAGVSFTIGIILFSGTLYAFGVTGIVPVEGAAPAGGLALMAGWAALAWIGVKGFIKS